MKQEQVDKHTDADFPYSEFTSYSKPQKMVVPIQDWETPANMFKDLVLQAPVGMMVLQGEELIIELVNDAFSTMTGRTSSELIFQPFLKAIPEAKGQPFGKAVDKVYKTGDPCPDCGLMLMVPAAGATLDVYVSFSLKVITDANGTASGIMAVIKEVGDPRSVSRRIEVAQERARLAIQSADLGVYEVNLLTHTIDADARLNEIFGADHLTTWKEITDSIHPDDAATREKAIAEASITGQLAYEVRIIKKDKSVCWIKAKGNVVFNGRGEALKIIGMVQDITGQKQICEALEMKLQERTKELAVSNYQLQQTNMELNQFAYIASHDLQEPLRKVKTFMGLMQSTLTEMPNKARVYIQKMRGSIERMQMLIYDVLQYSQVTKSTQELQEVDLNIVLKKVMSNFQTELGDKSGSVTIDLLPVLQAVPGQISQLFTQLLSNALKFKSHSRELIVSLTSFRLTTAAIQHHKELNEGRAYHQIVFKDNGIGFSPEYAKRIFLIFQRLHGREKYEGTGVGLAVCKKIVENHQGFIHAQADTDKGATFYIILPEVQQ